jgi:hypothetical protein
VAIESALVFLVPEAEALVGRFRDRHDPAAAAGMPAHITLLYPFKSPDAIDAAVERALRQCFAPFAPFPSSLRRPGASSPRMRSCTSLPSLPKPFVR